MSLIFTRFLPSGAVRQPGAALALALVAVLLFLAGPARAQLYETPARQAMLLDVGSGTILFSKDADAPIPPASLAKLMTMEVVFHALKAQRLTLQDRFLVSENAWRTGGAVSGTSTMFAELNSEIALEDLIRGVIVQSANDGCIIIAEGIAGSEEAFAQLMNDRARAIGMTGSTFVNSTGLPADGQTVTIRDLVTLAQHMQRTYPEFYRYYSETEFTWNGIRQRNRNPLLPMDIGADGMKTGFTEASGYAIVGSVARSGRRLIVAMSGMESERQRAEEARKMLDWGIRAFEPHRLFEAGEEIGNVRLYGGEAATAPVMLAEPLTVLMPLTGRDTLRARIVFDGPVPAPVEQGDPIAELHIYFGDELAHEAELQAAGAVGKGPIHRQALDALLELAIGWIRF
ncbi:MAG: D-alanyl-D-alanine carboxypeptidase [Roseitalea sp.]|nr:D-alanyl-D-alanine carboxypeptidase [Roseitalea sp.]MBO6722364.1 D-alanyl-D-alanine carboxypeptidase [Roseitalea sp.]MBO6744367.1 D-alanyl-D-alanine carboxypeptidase [Roseitalea sp.]